jgi:hypothetical protein
MANGKDTNIWCIIKLILLLIITVMVVLIYLEVHHKKTKEKFGASGSGYRKHFD